MTDLRTAAQQALEALEIGYDSAKAEADQYHEAMAGYKPHRHAAMDADVQMIASAISALKAALSQQAEPVAWMVYTLDGKSVCVTDNPDDFTEQHRALPLYTAPPAPQQAEPVCPHIVSTREGTHHCALGQRKPLTDNQIADIYIKWDKTPGVSMADFARTIERAHGITQPDLSHLARYGIPEPDDGNPSF